MKLDYQNYVLGLLLCLPIFATAQVGINNTDPQAQLDITASNVATPSNTDGLLIPRVNAFPATNPTATQQGMLVYLTTTVGLNLPGFYYWDNTTTAWKTISPTPTEIDPQVSSTGNNRVPKWNLTSLVDSQIYDNGTNVGVGTTAPGQKLDVNGNIRGTNIYATSYLQVGGLLPNTVTPIAAFHTGGSMPVLIGDSSINKGILIGRIGNDIQGRAVANFTSNSDLLLNSQGGNVGIGTTAPTQKLHVSGGNILADRAAVTGTLTRKLTLEGARATAGISFSEINFDNYDSTTSIAYTGASIQSHNEGTEDGDLRFFTNNGTLTERMNITNNGFVGIGTSTPAEKLEIVGKTKTTNIQITNGATPGYVLQSDATGNGTWVNSSTLSESDPQVSSSTSNYVPKWNGTTLIDGQVFDNGTNIGIGTTTPIHKLDVNGNIRGTNMYATSYLQTGALLPNTVTPIATFNTSSSMPVLIGDSSVNKGILIGKNGNDIQGRSIANFTANSDLLLNSLGGNVGIGTTTPTEKLHVSGGNILADRAALSSSLTRKLVLEGARAIPGNAFSEIDFNNYDSSTSISYTGASIQSQNYDGAEDGDLRFYTNNGTLTEKMIINPSGFVGIGTSTPSALLSIGSNMTTAGLINSTIINTTGNAPLFVGETVGDKGIIFGYDGNNIQGRSGTNFGINGDLVLNNYGGNVGIGTSTPTQAMLVVNGSQNFTTAYGYLSSTGTIGTSGSSSNPYSIYATSRIAATEFNAFSDARIKKVLRRSNSKEDLSILSKIQITDYKHIDTIANSNKTIKKVIAQEIKEVFPSAVSIHSDFIPNIYKLSEINNGIISAVNDFKKGDKVKLIFTDGEKIVEVKNATAVNFEINSEKSGKVFVYGKQVNDFHTVDYEALSTLNISATQELLKRIENLEKQNQKLEEQVSEVKSLKMENLKLKAENISIHEMQKDIELLKKTLLNDVSKNEN